MKKKVVTIISVLLVVILIGGISFAFFSYFRESANSQFVSGNIYLKLDDETDSISLPNAFPETKEKAREREDNTLTFTIKGKNTSEKDVMYSIELNNGANNSDNTKSRFDAEDLLFDLVEIDGQTRTYLINALGYNEFNHTKIWDEIVKANTEDEISHTYELRVWINQDVKFGEGEGVKYTSDEYAKKYATIKIAVSGNSLDDEYYKVSFDGQGGEVKRAYYYTKLGDNYDNLYTLKRDGYTFLGWNGKNMFNEEWLLSIPAIYENDYIVFSIFGAYSMYGRNGNVLPIYNFKENTRYTYTVMGHVSSGNLKIFLCGTYCNVSFLDLNNTTDYTWNYTSSASLTVQSSILSYGTNGIAYIKSIQLEEGTTSTSFEPYYITSNIKVTEWNTEMVLKAIWEANEYEIIFNANGGTGTMENQVMTYDTSNNLKSNMFTKEGYTFSGWSISPTGSIKYADSEEVTNLTTSGTITLYAKWTQNN